LSALFGEEAKSAGSRGGDDAEGGLAEASAGLSALFGESERASTGAGGGSGESGGSAVDASALGVPFGDGEGDGGSAGDTKGVEAKAVAPRAPTEEGL